MLGRAVHFLRRSIARKLTLTLIGFVGLTTLAAGLYLNQALEAFAVDMLAGRLLATARVLHDDARALIAAGADPPAARAFSLRAARPTGSRVTLLAADGRVLGDSEILPDDLAGIEREATRPEVQAALEGRDGRDLRASSEGGGSLLYAAIPIREGGRVAGVLRVALPLASVTASYATLHRGMLAGGVVALVVALGIGLFVARRVTRPVVEMQAIARRMSEGDFGRRAPVRSPDEIGTLGRALNSMAAGLREKIQDLEREQAKARAILDAMVEGVIAVDGRDAILLMNERARTLLGLGLLPRERQPFLEAVRNADLHAIFRESRTTGAGAVTRRELVLTRPERRLQVNSVPLPLGAGEIGVVMVLHDVSELRRLERVRTEFVANVSHELRTPLTAIHGYLETLLAGSLDEPETARRFLDIVFRHTERLGRLLDDLTDLSNIELGRISLRLGRVEVADVVDSVLAIIEPKAAGGRVGLRRDVASPLPAVRADRDRLAQILINLVDNAVKYTPEGGWVSVAARELPGGQVEIQVTDTGVGIPRADLSRVTERFYRVDRARSRELGGTGLGLAIVKHLVLAHGGELAIDSAPGQGTTVRVTLPGAPASPPA